MQFFNLLCSSDSDSDEKATIKMKMDSGSSSSKKKKKKHHKHKHKHKSHKVKKDADVHKHKHRSHIDKKEVIYSMGLEELEKEKALLEAKLAKVDAAVFQSLVDYGSSDEAATPVTFENDHIKIESEINSKHIISSESKDCVQKGTSFNRISEKNSEKSDTKKKSTKDIESDKSRSSTSKYNNSAREQSLSQTR